MVDWRTSQRAKAYPKAVKANLCDLLDRLHHGSYRPKPSLRKNISEGNIDIGEIAVYN